MSRTIFVSCLSISILWCAGCRDQGPDLARMTVPRIIQKPPTGDRMLAALVPEKESTWSFRLSGPEADVAALQPKFDAFLKSVKFGEKPPVKWVTPEGWTEQAGDQMRFATLKTGADPKALDVTVVELPREGGALLPNVNRWRGQLSLPPLEPGELDRIVKSIEIDGRKGSFVDLVGKLTAKAKMPALPQKAPPQAPPSDPEKLTFEVPAGWAKVKPKNAMIREQFDIVEGDKKAETTIVVLPGGAGGVLANLHRWRGQIKLPPADENELLNELTKIEIPAGRAIFTDLDNPKAAGDNRILGLILPRPGAMYFVKMIGPSDLVGRQKDRFQAFSKSLKFEP